MVVAHSGAPPFVVFLANTIIQEFFRYESFSLLNCVALRLYIQALKILQHLGLMFEMRVPFHAAAISCGRRRLDVVLHERVVLQRICILVCFFADLRVVLLGNLDEFHTRVVRLRRYARRRIQRTGRRRRQPPR